MTTLSSFDIAIRLRAIDIDKNVHDEKALKRENVKKLNYAKMETN